jgi:hypothetical protein
MKPDEIPEQTKLTMFDLIYYNPTNGSKMSNPSSRMTSRAPSPDRADAQCKIFQCFFSNLEFASYIFKQITRAPSR